MKPHAKLQSLSMDGCGLSSLDVTFTKALPSLKILSLVDNEIESSGCLKAISGMKKLEEIYVTDNEIEESSKHVKELASLQPNLKRVDLELLGTGPASQSLADRQKTMDLVAEAMKAKGGVMEANIDKATCSCVEGNPCAGSTNCFATVKQLLALGLAEKHPGLDLSTLINISGKKEEVAAAARRVKGIRD